MVIPATGPISFSALQTEFGGVNPISISEYYRNNVTVKDIAENAAVPTGGQISASNFRSAAYTEPFRVQYLAGGGGGGFNIGLAGSNPDPRRTIIVVQGCAAGGTGLQPPTAAIINNQTGNLAYRANSTAYDDGQGVTVTYLTVKTGLAPPVFIPNPGAATNWAVFAVYGHYFPMIQIIERRNTDGGDRPLGSTSIPIATPAGSAVMYIAYGNGGGGPAADPTGRLEVYVNTGIGVGFDTNPTAGATTYTYNGNIRPALLAAISFYKEF
jgi:hypothetical protein